MKVRIPESKKEYYTCDCGSEDFEFDKPETIKEGEKSEIKFKCRSCNKVMKFSDLKQEKFME